MTGLEAISAHNGWSIAAVGITIVFTGLTMLCIILSQLYKVLDFWEISAHGGASSFSG